MQLTRKMWFETSSLPMRGTCILILPRNINKILIHFIKVRFVLLAPKLWVISRRIPPEPLDIDSHPGMPLNTLLDISILFERNSAGAQLRIDALD